MQNFKRERGKKTKQNKIEQGQIKPKCFKWVLYNLNGHSGFRFLVISLNDSKNLLFFIASGIIDKILGARYDIGCVPYFTELTLLLRNV